MLGREGKGEVVPARQGKLWFETIKNTNEASMFLETQEGMCKTN
jgi:hypothetical protein